MSLAALFEWVALALKKQRCTNFIVRKNHFSRVFKGGDKLHSYETNAESAIVYGSTGKHDHGSSKIKLKNIVDYKWEVKNYMGRLIAIHIGGKYVAYAIKGKKTHT